ncbi:MAG: hypothetical protein WAM09_15500 [Anaerolineales bacterium]|jgi:hypothetical protein
MKRNIINIFWGVVLIALGGLFLADKLGYVNLELITSQGWGIIFAVTSAAFFLSYFLSGIRNWGWLFPALIFATLALTISMILGNPDSSIMAVPILLSIGIPFYIGYLLNRKHWELLIPAWILTVVAVTPILSESINSDLVGALFLFATALPFLVVYLVNRQRKWALITGIVLGFIAIFPLLGSFLQGDIQGPVVMFLFALLFLIIYIVSKKQWWVLIPSGVFASIGLVALLDTLLPNHDYFLIGDLQFGVYTGVLFLGFAITFGILWLLRASQPTNWAKYPAIGLLIASILAFLMGKTFNDLIPGIALLVIGIVMILIAILKRQGTHQPTS